VCVGKILEVPKAPLLLLEKAGEAIGNSLEKNTSLTTLDLSSMNDKEKEREDDQTLIILTFLPADSDLSTQNLKNKKSSLLTVPRLSFSSFFVGLTTNWKPAWLLDQTWWSSKS